jgi:hypothetical protein
MLRRESAFLDDELLWNNVTGRKNELLDREMKACVLLDKSNTSQQPTRGDFTEEAIVGLKTKGGSRRKQTRGVHNNTAMVIAEEQKTGSQKKFRKLVEYVARFNYALCGTDSLTFLLCRN